MSENIKDYTGCLNHLAFEPKNSRGTRNPLPSPELTRINPYTVDIVAILDSKAYRRLDEKTQVFTDPISPHVRNRLTHTGEVTSTSLLIAELLGLNKELCQAIALAHDIGHAPYGHLGESVLSEIIGRRFQHAHFGVMVAEEIERGGEGLNLTQETLLGISIHSGFSSNSLDNNIPVECKVPMYADKIAYLFADVNDISRINFPNSRLMCQKADIFGGNQRERVWKCISELLKESAEMNTLSFEKSEIAEEFAQFRIWMYQEIYSQFSPMRRAQKSALLDINQFFSTNPIFEGCDPAILLALMTDREADRLVNLIRNKPLPSIEEISYLGIIEIIPFLKEKRLSYNPIPLENFWR
jgi:dGTPase